MGTLTIYFADIYLAPTFPNMLCASIMHNSPLQLIWGKDVHFLSGLFMSQRAVCCEHAQSMQVEINTHYDDWQEANVGEAQIDSDGELK